MRIKKHKGLWLVFTSLFVMVCRCDGGTVTYTTADNISVQCVSFIEGSSSVVGTGRYCPIVCSDGVERPFTFYRDPEFKDRTYAEIYQKACAEPYQPAALNDQSPAEEPTEAPTEEPTEEPTAPPVQPNANPVPPQSYLTGAVTACDLPQRYINFAVNPAAASQNPADLRVTFNDAPVSCTPVPAGQPNVLSCVYPANTAFPIHVVVRLGSSIVNDFYFDGALCSASQPPKPSDPENPEDPAPPVVPSPDCSTPTNDGC